MDCRIGRLVGARCGSSGCLHDACVARVWATFFVLAFAQLLARPALGRGGEPGPAAEARAEPPFTRLMLRPAWDVDLTDRLFRVEADGKTTPYTDAMSHAAQAGAKAPNGAEWIWETRIELPAGQASARVPLVLEADESRVISSVEVDGVALPPFDRSFEGSRLSDGQGFVMLPADCAGKVLRVRCVPLDQIYSNGFGRLRVRPATVSESVSVSMPDDGRVTLRNRSPFALRLAAHVRHENYFGAPLGAIDGETFELAAGAERIVDLNAPTNDPECYKSRFWLTTPDGRTSYDHWWPYRAHIQNHARPEVRQLSDNWEYAPDAPNAAIPDVNDAQKPDARAPQAGWKKLGQPITAFGQEGGPDYVSHVNWYRTTVVRPRDWKSARLQLFLAGIVSHATVYIDGREVARRASWELPDAVNLPASVNDGKPHELLIRTIDYVVGLKPGTPVPTNNPSRPNLDGRAWIAPVPCAPNPMGADTGMTTWPELLGVPEVRVDFAPIRTTVAPGPIKLDASLQLRNDTDRDVNVRGTAVLLYRGKEIDRVDLTPTRIPAKGDAQSAVAMTPHGVKLWDLEHPELYELRIMLTDDAGKMLDVRRERFGFRQFGTEGDHFVLNGHRVNLYGGSHVVLSSQIWPLRLTTYRILRLNFQVRSTALEMNLADELGTLTKPEHPNLNELHQDHYDFGEPIFWQRLESQMRQNYRTLANSPSNVIWNIGNELYIKDFISKFHDFTRVMRAIDPTRLVSADGSSHQIFGNDLYDMHGWGQWARRDEFYFLHPEQRPSYYREGGFFARIPQGEPADRWKLLNGDIEPKWGYPATPMSTDLGKTLLALPPAPVLFSEGHYYESWVVPELSGIDCYRIPPGLKQKEKYWKDGIHLLNILASRMQSTMNVRQARCAGSMIHVDRGVGRRWLPLAAFSYDRKFRFESGQRLQSVWSVHDDLTGDRKIKTAWTLYDGVKVIATQTEEAPSSGGELRFVKLDMPLPEVTRDTIYRLHVEVSADDEPAGYYRDDVEVTVFAPRPLQVPAGQTVEIFDPRNSIASKLVNERVVVKWFRPLSAFEPSGNTTLLIGEEALSDPSVDAATLDRLRQQIRDGARVIVLQHKELPRLVSRGNSQWRMASGTLCPTDTVSPLLMGLRRRDLQWWDTAEQDQIVYWNGLGIPATGNFRPHLLADDDRTTPLIEIAEGRGSVMFCQLNIGAALGRDPAARRILANLLTATALPAPFARANTVLLTTDTAFATVMRRQVGVEASPVAALRDADWSSAKCVIVNGTDAPAVASLVEQPARLTSYLDGGGTLFVKRPDQATLDSLNRTLGTSLRIERADGVRAWIARYDPLVQGLTHSLVYWESDWQFQRGAWTDLEGRSIGDRVVVGEGVTPLVDPAFVSVLRRGDGRIVFDLTNTLEKPVSRSIRLTSTLLSNAGAMLRAGGITDDVARAGLVARPIDLMGSANAPLADALPEPLRDLKRGTVDVAGTPFVVAADPAAVVVRAGELERATRVEGIKFGFAARSIRFLHALEGHASGVTYRVYFTERRRNWIPGQPNPFVDVVVKRGDGIADVGAADVLGGKSKLPSASIAFAAPADAPRAGLYQFVWENPFPDEKIESIDVIGPSDGGEGRAIVVAITADVKPDAAPK
jgi:hypothetical protein